METQEQHRRSSNKGTTWKLKNKVPRDEIYAIYKEYAKKNGRMVLSRQKFFKVLVETNLAVKESLLEANIIKMPVIGRIHVGKIFIPRNPDGSCKYPRLDYVHYRETGERRNLTAEDVDYRGALEWTRAGCSFKNRWMLLMKPVRDLARDINKIIAVPGDGHKRFPEDAKRRAFVNRIL